MSNRVGIVAKAGYVGTIYWKAPNGDILEIYDVKIWFSWESQDTLCTLI